MKMPICFQCIIALLLITLVSCNKNIDKDLYHPGTFLSSDEMNQQVLDELDFTDSLDFENASRGFIATRKDPEIKNKEGDVIMNLGWFNFMNKDAPSTVNPSLWRQGQLNRMHGLYEVCEGIYQVRGFDLANMTVVATDNGWIVIDPLTSEEAARAAMDLIDNHLGKRPIKAVIFTHSHIDHFGGIKGIVSQDQVSNGEAEIIAPEGFYESAISENVLAGNGMQRRAMYMFGSLIPFDTLGFVGSGLGQSVSIGTYGILEPTIDITETGQKVIIDGIEMIFQNTPDAEAPAECMFYFPKYKAFCQAEEINHTLHNLYTLRGAEVRNGLKWAKYIDQSVQMFGNEVEISFGTHHWPTWGRDRILELWTKQRDLYKFIHDQTLYLANNGYTSSEIAELIQLPESLSSFFANRGYYGSLSHNAKAQYQLYYGWFDGNPANLHALPPGPASSKYVEYMGGADAVIDKVKIDIESGELRWAAMVLNHIIFDDPTNRNARALLAQVYDLLAYSAESGPWRNFYLTGAQELLEGKTLKYYRGSPDREAILENLSLETFYDYMAVRLDRQKVKGKEYAFNFIFPDVDEKISVFLINEVLHNRPGVLADNPNATITMDRSVFNQIITKKTTGLKKLISGEIKIKGSKKDYSDFQDMIEGDFDLLFNIVDP